MTMHHIRKALVCTSLSLFATVAAFAQTSGALPILGRVMQDEKKISEATVNLFVANDLVETFTTGKNGRFELELMIGKEYTVEIIKEGYMQKRFAVDAKNNVPEQQVDFVPFPMDIHLLKEERFEGIDNDVLEFPFALITYSKRKKDFDHDPEYTQNMLRANAALMLISARAKD